MASKLILWFSRFSFFFFTFGYISSHLIFSLTKLGPYPVYLINLHASQKKIYFFFLAFFSQNIVKLEPQKSLSLQ